MQTLFQQKMDQFLSEYCEKAYFSGSLRVTKNDEIIYQRFIGQADREENLPLNESSVFTLYSLSKPFCAMGLLKLKDKNEVNLDKHPGEYVPEASGFDSGVTIRQMLHHTSGLPDFEQTKEFCEKYAPGLPEKIREHVKYLTAYPLLFKPGTGSMYANINFNLCALIIENVSGMPYAAYMKKEIFEPLGMNAAQIDGENPAVQNRVKGYALQEGQILPIERCSDWELGAGDILGTVDDVYCLNKAIKNRLLLKEDTWREALTPSPISGMGMGCTVSDWHGKIRITHNGGHLGFRTLHVQLPADDFDIILLSNCGWGDARNEISEAIHEAYYGSDCTESKKIQMDSGYI